MPGVRVSSMATAVVSAWQHSDLSHAVLQQADLSHEVDSQAVVSQVAVSQAPVSQLAVADVFVAHCFAARASAVVAQASALSAHVGVATLTLMPSSSGCRAIVSVVARVWQAASLCASAARAATRLAAQSVMLSQPVSFAQAEFDSQAEASGSVCDVDPRFIHSLMLRDSARLGLQTVFVEHSPAFVQAVASAHAVTELDGQCEACGQALAVGYAAGLEHADLEQAD